MYVTNSVVSFYWVQSGGQVPVDGKIPPPRPVFIPEVSGYTGMIAFGVFASARASFWLDNNNQKLFDCFNKDLTKTSLVPPTGDWDSVWQITFPWFYYVTYMIPRLLWDSSWCVKRPNKFNVFLINTMRYRGPSYMYNKHWNVLRLKQFNPCLKQPSRHLRLTNVLTMTPDVHIWVKLTNISYNVTNQISYIVLIKPALHCSNK